MSDEAGAFLRSIESSLLALERERPLLALFQPLGGLGHQKAVVRALEADREPEPGVFPAVGSDRTLRRTLEAARLALGPLGSAPVPRLLLARIDELDLEFELVAGRGSRGVAELSRRRFHVAEEELADAARSATEWLERTEAALLDEDVLLVEEFRRVARERGLDLRVREGDLFARAAVTPDEVLVRRGERLGRRAALRVVLHEIDGHFLPRRAALSAPVPLRIGMPGGDADEEGRAILLEERADLLDGSRRRELALRFRCAVLCRGGASALESYRTLRAEGVDGDELGGIVARVYRGGGLAREVVYLPAFLRVRRALAACPEWERAFQAGRASVAGLREFADAELETFLASC